jgi:hypothetical protein
VPPVRAFTGSPQEQLEVVGRHPGRWVVSAVSIATAVVLTLTGLVLLVTPARPSSRAYAQSRPGQCDSRRCSLILRVDNQARAGG